MTTIDKQTEIMTLDELIDWAAIQSCSESLEAVLVNHGLIDADGVYQEVHSHTRVEIVWPAHARIHRPNGDIFSVRVVD